MTHLRLLHVDDDPDFLDLSARVFGGFGDRYAVETVDDAGAALDRLARGGVDCLVSDSLRTATGEAFVVAARRAAADLPIVFRTGSEWDAVATDADAAGTAGYVRKGRGDFARLRETVDVAATFHLEDDEVAVRTDGTVAVRLAT